MLVHVCVSLCVSELLFFCVSCVQLRKTKNMVAKDGDVVLSGCGCSCPNCFSLTYPSGRQTVFLQFHPTFGHTVAQ